MSQSQTSKPQYPYCPVRFTMCLPDGLSTLADIEWFDENGEPSRAVPKTKVCDPSSRAA